MNRLTIVTILIIAFSRLSFADNLEDFLWAENSGESTSLSNLQDENDGYIIRDKDGNETWVDNIEEPQCAFTLNSVEVKNNTEFDGDIQMENYIGSIDLSGCDIR